MPLSNAERQRRHRQRREQHADALRKTLADLGISPDDMEYLSEIPAAVPPGKVVVHNNVKPAHPLGMNGFRAWLSASPPRPTYTPCGCGWAPELPVHYRVIGLFDPPAGSA